MLRNEYVFRTCPLIEFVRLILQVKGGSWKSNFLYGKLVLHPQAMVNFILRSLFQRRFSAFLSSWKTYVLQYYITEFEVNQSTVSTAKRLACLFWYFIASTIDTLHNTINGYEIACIWNSKYNVYVCMIQTNADFIFQKLIVFVSWWL